MMKLEKAEKRKREVQLQAKAKHELKERIRRVIHMEHKRQNIEEQVRNNIKKRQFQEEKVIQFYRIIY